MFKYRMRRWLTLGIPTLFAALLIAVLLTPTFRDAIREYLQPTGREVLATAEGDLLHDGSQTKVIKVRTADGIYVEVLRPPTEDGQRPVLDRVLLPDRHDGLFNFKGRITRLVITTELESAGGEPLLLAPTFDAQLVPHLNVMRYNKATQHLEAYTPTAK